MKKIDIEIRKSVYKRDDFLCQICGEKVILTRKIKTEEDYSKEASLDHITPISKGGTDSLDNLQTCCRSCNSRKKNRNKDELRFLNVNNGEFTKIHNCILLALSRTKLNTQEGRILFAIIAKTYGFNKSEDWISNSQLEEITNIHRCHCSNTISRLKKRKIVTQTGNKIKLNKYFFEWTVLPKQVTKTATKKVLPKQDITVTQTGNQILPKQVTTKDILTKDILQKKKKVIKKNFLDHVKLTQKEYSKLLEDFGKEKLDACIEKLDNFIPNSKSARSYTDHNRVLRGWVEKWYDENSIQSPKSFTINS